MQGIGLSSCWNQPQQVTAIGQHVHQSVPVRRDISYPVHIVQHCLSQRLSIAVHCDAEQISMLQAADEETPPPTWKALPESYSISESAGDGAQLTIGCSMPSASGRQSLPAFGMRGMSAQP